SLEEFVHPFRCLFQRNRTFLTNIEQDRVPCTGAKSAEGGIDGFYQRPGLTTFRLLPSSLRNLDQFDLFMRIIVRERDTIVVCPRFYSQQAENPVILDKSQMNI